MSKFSSDYGFGKYKRSAISLLNITIKILEEYNKLFEEEIDFIGENKVHFNSNGIISGSNPDWNYGIRFILYKNKKLELIEKFIYKYHTSEDDVYMEL